MHAYLTLCPLSYNFLSFPVTVKSHYKGLRGEWQTSSLYPNSAMSITIIKYIHRSWAGTCGPGPLLPRFRYKGGPVITGFAVFYIRRDWENSIQVGLTVIRILQYHYAALSRVSALYVKIFKKKKRKGHKKKNP